MSTFDYQIQLVKVVPGGRDKEGFPVPEQIIPNPPILANKLSVRSTDFWQARQAGLEMSYVFEVHSFEYNEESRLIYEGNEYDIVRTYEKGDLMELHCRRFDGESR